MKKRLVSLLLAAVMVLALVPMTAFADETDVGVDNQFVMQFTVDKVTVGNDDELVDISIAVDRNGGFAAMNYQLVFDKNVFTLEEQPKVNAEMGFEFVSGPLDVAASEGKHLGMLVSEENIYTNGVLVTYTFKIAPDAAAGVYSFRLITDGVADLPDGTINLEVLDDSFVKLPNVSEAGTVTIPGYKVTYDANGGTGAPAAQTKSKNGFVYVSTVRPERDGYRFLGWATSATAETAEYVGGDKYSENADVTLYAVWERLGVIAGTIDLTAGTVEAKAGDEIEVPVSIAGNTGLLDLEFSLVFDDTRLKYLSASLASDPVYSTPEEAEEAGPFELDELMFIKPNVDNVTNSANFAFSSSTGLNLLGNGTFVIVKFKVLDEAEDGFADISIVPTEASKLYGEKALPTPLDITVTGGGVEVSSQLLGDINLDGIVNSDDAVLLLQHLLFGETIFPIDYSGTLDFNKDGNENSDDAVRLLQYALFGDTMFPID